MALEDLNAIQRGMRPDIMIDFYEELKIKRTLTIIEINRELSKLENIWRRRELTNPEKATKMLALILDAREVFQTEATRKKYDCQFDVQKEGTNNKEEQTLLQMGKLKSDSISFYNSKQYDLALITINKALSLMTSLNIEDGSILNLAADIHRFNGDYGAAKAYINRAIIADSENPMNYYIKGMCEDSVSERRKNLKVAINIADERDLLNVKKEILGVFAYSLYFEKPQNQTQAEQYAREALRLGETWGNAKEVIIAIEKEIQEWKRQQEEQKRKAREKAAQEEEQKRAAEKKREEQEQKERKQKKARFIGIILKPISLVVPFIVYIHALKATAGTVKCAEVLCFGGFALIGWIFLWMRFWE